MSKFSQICKGARARKAGVECTTLEGEAFTLDLRLMNAAEEAAVIERASKYAKEHDGEAKETNLVFQFANACEIVAIASVDPESPADAPAPFFDDVKQVREHLDRERILYIAETQRAFQDEVSPRQLRLTESAYIATLWSFAQEEIDLNNPFFRWPRSTQWNFLHTFSSRHIHLLELNADSGTGSTKPQTN